MLKRTTLPQGLHIQSVILFVFVCVCVCGQCVHIQLCQCGHVCAVGIRGQSWGVSPFTVSYCSVLLTGPRASGGVLTSHLYKGITDGITDAWLLDGLWESEFRSHLATLYQSLISSIAMKWSVGSEGTVYY